MTAYIFTNFTTSLPFSFYPSFLNTCALTPVCVRSLARQTVVCRCWGHSGFWGSLSWWDSCLRWGGSLWFWWRRWTMWPPSACCLCCLSSSSGNSWACTYIYIYMYSVAWRTTVNKVIIRTCGIQRVWCVHTCFNASVCMNIKYVSIHNHVKKEVFIGFCDTFCGKLSTNPMHMIDVPSV